MWSRKELKKKARILIKSNYWRSVSVCFLIAMLTASYPISRSLFLNYFPDKIQTKTALILPVFISAESFSSAFLDFIPDNFIAAAFLHTVQNYLWKILGAPSLLHRIHKSIHNLFHQKD